MEIHSRQVCLCCNMQARQAYLRQCRWKTCPHVNFLFLEVSVISSLQMMQTLSLSRSPGAASGNLSSMFAVTRLQCGNCLLVWLVYIHGGSSLSTNVMWVMDAVAAVESMSYSCTATAAPLTVAKVLARQHVPGKTDLSRERQLVLTAASAAGEHVVWQCYMHL